MDIRFFPAAKIAYWYFRLNGFLTVENFVVHPKLGEQQSQRTEADLCGVRFPNRRELNMKDDGAFQPQSNKALFVIAEITRAECKLNSTWRDRENIEYILSALGAFPADELRGVVDALSDQGIFPKGDQEPEFQFVAVGRNESKNLKEMLPQVLQLTLDHMLEFIHLRFDSYRTQKVDHSQWDEWGRYLWTLSERYTAEPFVQEVMKLI